MASTEDRVELVGCINPTQLSRGFNDTLAPAEPLPRGKFHTTPIAGPAILQSHLNRVLLEFFL